MNVHEAVHINLELDVQCPYEYVNNVHNVHLNLLFEYQYEAL